MNKLSVKKIEIRTQKKIIQKEVVGFAYINDLHKFYLLATDKDADMIKNKGYKVSTDLKKLEKLYNNSYDLRFIDYYVNDELTNIIPQGIAGNIVIKEII